MVAKTYYDEIANFDYSNRTISFEMPFTWDPAYVAQVPVLHMEVQFPKSLEDLQTNSYRGMLNGRELEAQAVVIPLFGILMTAERGYSTIGGVHGSNALHVTNKSE
jgi:hypothetical protein